MKMGEYKVRVWRWFFWILIGVVGRNKIIGVVKVFGYKMYMGLRGGGNYGRRDFNWGLVF